MCVCSLWAVTQSDNVISMWLKDEGGNSFLFLNWEQSDAFHAQRLFHKDGVTHRKINKGMRRGLPPLHIAEWVL